LSNDILDRYTARTPPEGDDERGEDAGKDTENKRFNAAINENGKTNEQCSESRRKEDTVRKACREVDLPLCRLDKNLNPAPTLKASI